MRYLIYHDNEAFLTDYFEIESMYTGGMIVFDLGNGIFYDGKEWKKIEEDSL